LQTNDSPTRTVGGKTSSKFEKVKHEIGMLSLKNAFNDDDLRNFDRQIKDLFSSYSYFVEPKIDGLSISIIYNNGKLEKAITRGDGIIGEDVTNNVLQIESLPKEIALKDKMEVRGEIFISKKTFDFLNKQREEADEQLFANARNAASGTLRQIDSNVVRERNLNIYLY
jgi:DNA ligase (NAD+)